MNPSPESSHGRRAFFRTAVLAAGAATLKPSPSGGAPAEGAAGPAASVGYLCFSPDEAAFVEALVEVMCPADDLTPGGIDCGLAHFMDRQLAGPFGKGDRLYRRGPWRPGRAEDGYQLPLTPEQFFKAGIKAANQACHATHRRAFPELTAEEASHPAAHFDRRSEVARLWFQRVVRRTTWSIRSSPRRVLPIRFTAAIAARSSGVWWATLASPLSTGST